MSLRFLFVLMFFCVSTAAAQAPNRIKPPVLKNREAIIAERERIAQKLLQPGDSLLIKVFAYVDENGVTKMPEVKTSSGNAKADTAAMQLVSRMQWQPAQNVRRGVMMTIPVKLVRK
jgi:hypothetical protein